MKKIRRAAAMAAVMSMGMLAVSGYGKELDKISEAKIAGEKEAGAENGTVEQSEEPFRVKARCRTYFDDDQEAMAQRLEVRFLIENMTKKDYQDVSYICSLNEEVKDYIADGMIELHNDLYNEPVDVTYLEKLEEKPDEESAVCGFSMCWGMLLTPEEELQEIYHRSPEGLKDAVKSLEVEINWKGGAQIVSAPLTVEEDVDWPDEDWEEIFDGMERQGEDQILDQSEENAEI